MSSLLPTYPLGLLLVHQQALIVLQNAHVWFFPAIEWHAHLPGSTEHRRVFDGDFVIDVVGTRQREPFDQVQSIAVKIARPIEPCLVGEMHDIDNQSVSFPVSA